MTDRRISDGLAALIDAYQRATAAFERVDPADPAWDAAGAAVTDALKALLGHGPASLAEFHAKFVALVPATRHNGEDCVLRHLAEELADLTEDGR